MSHIAAERIGALLKVLGERIVFLDGAMGTVIQQEKLDESGYRGERFQDWAKPLQGNNDLLNLTQPELIRRIHGEYLRAGADIIETNTFNATSVSLADYGLEREVYDINLAGAQNARKAVEALMAEQPGRRAWVAGALGPTSKTASLSPDVQNPAYRTVSFEDLVEVYREQACALLDGGVDLLMVETVFDTLNAKAALFAISQLYRERGILPQLPDKPEEAAPSLVVPVMLSFTITDLSGRTLSGQTVEAFWNSVSHFPLISVGINCALGPKEMRPFVAELAEISDIHVSAYPNAGLPDPLLPTGFPETPGTLAPQLREWASSGWLNIVGGCCGTTPRHIEQLVQAVKGLSPRRPRPSDPLLRLSGLEALTVRPDANFVNVGERTNIAGSPKFARLIKAGDYEAALTIARQQVENGAQIIDINMDEGFSIPWRR